MSTLKNKKVSEERLASLPIIGAQPKNEKEEKFLREICEFEFFNLENEGLSLPFSYGDSGNNQKFELEHGGKYRVPRFVARHLETRSTPIYKWRPDGTGSMRKTQVGTKPRFRMSQVFE